jgi:glycine/D-amino acid oxidase-like deaminating enzyme
VTYQLDRGRFVGRDVVVIGGGDSGTLGALELARRLEVIDASLRNTAVTTSSSSSQGVAHRDLPGWSWTPWTVATDSRGDGVQRRRAAPAIKREDWS